jgi:hypothetical protein
MAVGRKSTSSDACIEQCMERHEMREWVRNGEPADRPSQILPIFRNSQILPPARPSPREKPKLKLHGEQ